MYSFGSCRLHHSVDGLNDRVKKSYISLACRLQKNILTSFTCASSADLSIFKTVCRSEKIKVFTSE